MIVCKNQSYVDVYDSNWETTPFLGAHLWPKPYSCRFIMEDQGPLSLRKLGEAETVPSYPPTDPSKLQTQKPIEMFSLQICVRKCAETWMSTWMWVQGRTVQKTLSQNVLTLQMLSIILVYPAMDGNPRKQVSDWWLLSCELRCASSNRSLCISKAACKAPASSRPSL